MRFFAAGKTFSGYYKERNDKASGLVARQTIFLWCHPEFNFFCHPEEHLPAGRQEATKDLRNGLRFFGFASE
jgi:hypothetical protein